MWLLKPWECHSQRQYELWGLRNHVQFSMKTISYYQLHLSLPAWRGWLKSLWHILFLVHSQAQMVSGKTILAKLCVRMFIRICFAVSHFIFASFCKSLCLSHFSPYFTFSSLRAVRCTGTFKMAGIFVSLLEFNPLAATYCDVFEGITNSHFFFRLEVPLHGHLYHHSTAKLLFWKGNMQKRIAQLLLMGFNFHWHLQ